MKVLVINAGSSSVKYALIETDGEETVSEGVVERIGIDGTRIKGTAASGDGFEEPAASVSDTRTAVELVGEVLVDDSKGADGSLDEIEAVGHRVVHGGEDFSDPTIIDDAVMRTIRELFELAPLHNPVNYAGIEAARELLGGVPHVAVFDTAFHATIPDRAFVYGLPYEYYSRKRIRKYGFHGTSHKYVSIRAAEMLGKPLAEANLVTCHLGNGCSITAVRDGRSIDTSMGLTPLEGVMMGTRSGNIDPAIILHLQENEGLSAAEVNRMLNKQSGLLGLAGIGSSDMRDVLAARAEGNEQADLAFRAYAYRIRLYVGAYAVAVGKLDAVVFTGGVGENSPDVRAEICHGLECIGVEYDVEFNKDRTPDDDIAKPGTGRRILIISTQEDEMIARETASVVAKAGP